MAQAPWGHGRRGHSGEMRKAGGAGAGQCGTPGKPGTGSPASPGQMRSQEDGPGAWGLGPFPLPRTWTWGRGGRTSTRGQAGGREVKAAQARGSTGPPLWVLGTPVVGGEPPNPTRRPGPTRLPVWALCFSAQWRPGPPLGRGAEFWVPRPSLVQGRGQLWAWERGSAHGDDRPQAAGYPAAPAWLSAKLATGALLRGPQGRGAGQAEEQPQHRGVRTWGPQRGLLTLPHRTDLKTRARGRSWAAAQTHTPGLPQLASSFALGSPPKCPLLRLARPHTTGPSPPRACVWAA